MASYIVPYRAETSEGFLCRQTETRQEGHMGERGRTRAKWRKEHEARARANEHARRRGGVGRHGTMGVDDWSVLRSTSTAEAGLGLGPLGDDLYM